MNCRFCGESASYRYCETCHNGTLPECDKQLHETVPVCSDCLHWYYECEEKDKRYDEDFVSSCPVCAEIREQLENENNEE